MSIWKAGLWAGWIAGVIDHAVLIAILLVAGISPWVHARGTAAMVLGPRVLEPAADGAVVLLTATAVHFVLSLVYGVIVSWLVRGRRRGPALAIGTAFGVLVWIANYYVVAPLAFPWLVPNGTLPGMPLAHVVLGATAAACCLRLQSAGDRARRSAAPA
jgi:hypothetical protein